MLSLKKFHTFILRAAQSRLQLGAPEQLCWSSGVKCLAHGQLDELADGCLKNERTETTPPTFSTSPAWIRTTNLPVTIIWV